MAQTTKKMLAYALAELLKTKPLSKITINDITGRCEINRMTFYYHFKDIYELVDWMFMETSVIPLETDVYSGDWQTGLRHLMENAVKNKSIILNIYNSLSRERIEKYIVYVFRKIFEDKIDKLSEGMDIADEDKEFVVAFYNKAFCGHVLDWISGGMQIRPDEDVDRLSRMLNGNLLFSLENMRRDKN
ncbi:MAG: TetR/AcrR family transcriptional regulator C-terminal domain-containing protein [Candidatus Ornithomonoglobus sp.]